MTDPVPHRLAWFLLGLASAAIGTLFVVQRLPAAAPVEVRGLDREVIELPGWEASFAVEGREVVARLERLHVEPGRQAFDAAQLGRLLERPGEPWRLSLVTEGEGNLPATRVELGDAPGLDPIPGRDHPVLRILASTAGETERILFGPGPVEQPVLVVGDLRIPLGAATRQAWPGEERPLHVQESPQ